MIFGFRAFFKHNRFFKSNTSYKGDKLMSDKSQTVQEFLDFALKGHIDDKTEGYIKEVNRILGLGLTEEAQVRKLTNEALVRTDIDSPEWSFVSARTLLDSLYSTASMLRKYDRKSKYGSLSNLIHMLVDKGLYGSFLLEKYSEEEIEEIGTFIDPDKDELFTYIGLRMLNDRYLARDFNDVIYELPQERFIVIAMTLMQNEKPSERLAYIKEAYWALSNLYMTVATPTLSNSGKTHGQLSSCFIDTVEDSLDGIYLDNWDTARVSKNGGGVGIYMGNVRGRNSSIKGFKDKASGVIPWIRQINNTAVSVDQLGMRQGAIAVYLDMWHWDLFEFLQIGTNNGDPSLKARDIFPGLCVPDYFMELIEADDEGRMINPENKWYLFDPHEVKQIMGWNLQDCFDEEEGNGTWRKRYQECIDHPLLRRKEVTVKEVVKAMVVAQIETSLPYMFYRDEANRKNPNKHKGIIYCSNLCTEIMQNMSITTITKEFHTEDGKIIVEREIGDYVVCNLSSINLARAFRDDVVERLVKIQVRMLDNVIDINNLPLHQATVTNKRYRPVGLGTFGWHHLLAIKGISWDDEKSVELADEVYEEVAFYTIKASVELAQEKGSYPYFEGSDWNTGEYFELRGYKTEGSRFDWDELKEDTKKGIRNGYLLAVAPNSSTALIAGSTQGIDPFYYSNGMYFEEKKNFKIPVIAPDMNADTFSYYFGHGAYQVSQEMSIRQNAKRQHHIDQAVSFNLYVPNNIKAKDLMQLHRLAWRSKMKTSYYIHNKPNTVIEAECEACQ